MDDNHPQLARIEQLLREGNQLRTEAVSLQREHLAMQRELMAGWRANLEQAGRVNQQALALQNGARQMQRVVLPVIVVALFIVGYLLMGQMLR